MRLLVIEDFAPLREAVVQGLGEAGYAVDAAGNGEEGLWHAQSGEHDVVVLDLMLPKVDGWTILQKIRETGSKARVLVLTARDTVADRVRGLDSGADDYLVKPFEFAELLARVRALIRRKYETKGTTIDIDDLSINLTTRQVRRGGKSIDLSGREYALLEFLAVNANRVVSRSDIWQHVYDFNASLESNVVDVYIGLLRKKLEARVGKRLIHTRRGQGYMLSDRVEGG